MRCRRQQELTGHRGRSGDRFYAARHDLLRARENLTDAARRRLEAAFRADPWDELECAWTLKEMLRDFYRSADRAAAETALVDWHRCAGDYDVAETIRLAETLRAWEPELLAYSDTRLTNGPTEGVNRIIKAVKRQGFGYTNADNYRPASSTAAHDTLRSIADEPATTVTTELQTAEEPTTGETATGDGPVTDEIRVAVLVDGEFVGSDGISETTRFRIGSVTKMFTAVVLSQLHADGLIDLDVPISTYLDIDSTVTTRDLLSHTAGLLAEPHEDVVFEWAWEDMSEPLPPSTMIELTEFTDDTAMYYSNSGYLYAGQIIEAVTGQDAAEVFAERIYEPLGLTSTCWPSHDTDWETDVPGVMDTTEVGGDGRDALVEEFVAVDSLAHSAGVLISTVEDLDRFVTALFDSELAGTDEFLASTTDPQYQIPRASVFSILMSAYGLGVMVFSDSTVGHDGQTIGFMSSVRYNPDTNESTIILVNDTTTSTDLILEQVLSTGTAPTAGDVVSFR